MTPEKITIKPELMMATKEDIPELIQIEQKVQDEIHKKAKNDKKNPNIYSATLTHEDWMEEFAKADVTFIVWNGKKVGSLILEEQDNGETLYIGGLVILPEFQRRGISRQILKDRIIAMQKKYKKIYLLTHPENPAKFLYEDLGFQVTEYLEDPYGEGEPRVKMVLK